MRYIIRSTPQGSWVLWRFYTQGGERLGRFPKLREAKAAALALAGPAGNVQVHA